MTTTIPHEIRELVLELGPVEWGTTPEHDAEGHGNHVRESVEMTMQHFNIEGPTMMHGLYLAGTETVVCHSGMSPNSSTIARILTVLWNKFHEELASPPPTSPSDDRKAALDELITGDADLYDVQRRGEYVPPMRTASARITGDKDRATQSRDRKSTRLNSSHTDISRMPSSA